MEPSAWHEEEWPPSKGKSTKVMKPSSFEIETNQTSHDWPLRFWSNILTNPIHQKPHLGHIHSKGTLAHQVWDPSIERRGNKVNKGSQEGFKEWLEMARSFCVKP